MPRYAASADRFQAKAQIKAGGPTFGRKGTEVKAAIARTEENAKRVAIDVETQAFSVTGRALRSLAMPRLGAKILDFGKSVFFHGDFLHAPVRFEGTLPKRDFWAVPPGDAFKLPPVPMRMYSNTFTLDLDPPKPRYAASEYRWVDEEQGRALGCWRPYFEVEPPPTDDPIERAARAKPQNKAQFQALYVRYRQRAQGKIVEALHRTMCQMGYKTMGSGVSRTTYALSKNTVLKVPNDANGDNYDANLKELRFWRKYKRRAVIKLAACRLVRILGVPCLLMQRLHDPKSNECHKAMYGDAGQDIKPVWAGRLDGYQCALTARGEWVAYDYGYQPEDLMTKPWSRGELAEITRRSSAMSVPEAAE